LQQKRYTNLFKLVTRKTTFSAHFAIAFGYSANNNDHIIIITHMNSAVSVRPRSKLTPYEHPPLLFLGLLMITPGLFDSA
jgi:hypothetical protein